ncbi:MAG: DUF1653 domain-containing protein [Spirochaetia bacterium]|nr:DUF1653 domain-containing protein [Spirochaetia bacterium]
MVVPKSLQKGLYRHFKGGLYEVVDTVIDSETLKTMVLYRPVDSSYLWVRDYDMFTSLVGDAHKKIKRFALLEEDLA